MLAAVLRRACHSQIRRSLLLHNTLTRPLVSVPDKKPIRFNPNISTQGSTESKLSKNDLEKDDFERLLPTNDPDTFGSLSTSVQENEGDEDDIKEEEFLKNPPPRWRQLGIRQYADMIKEYLRQKKVYEAIEVMEHRMLKEDGVKPTNYIFNILIDGCARVGYTQKAFSLYNKMKQRQLKVTGATYTSLFNACANSPYYKDALERANRLREIINEVGYPPNVTNYHAMIKAYGRLGDITTAFHLVDEMQTRKLPVRVETFNFLLQACASDKDIGFRHALLVWHKMYRRQMAPDLYSFNLLLRTTRDCGLGDVEESKAVIDELMTEAQHRKMIVEKRKIKQIASQGSSNVNERLMALASGGSTTTEASSGSTTTEPVNDPLETDTTTATDGSSDTPEVTDQSNDTLTPTLTIVDKPPSATEIFESNLHMPNLIAPIPRLGNLVSIGEVTKPEDRLLLLGGLNGFIDEMERHRIEPSIKTCTLLLEILPSNLESEKRLLTYIKNTKIRCDIDFYNILIKKRAMRYDMVAAQSVFKMIKMSNLEPDIVTYGVLAMGCHTQDEARALMAQMQEAGVSMNIEILGAMFRVGCHELNFDYVEEILKIVREKNLQPSEVFLKNLYKFKTYLGYLTKKGKDEPGNDKDERKQRERIKKFKVRLSDWMESYGIRELTLEEALKKFKTHPYKQFKEKFADGVEPEKNTVRQHWKKKKGKLFVVD